MNTYMVSMITDLDEPVSVCVQAEDEAEAEAIGTAMLENGELECVGMICVQCTATPA